MNFFESLKSIVVAIGDALGSAFETVAGIFYKTGAEGGGITFIGYLALAGIAVSLLGLGIRTILKLVNKKM